MMSFSLCRRTRAGRFKKSSAQRFSPPATRIKSSSNGSEKSNGLTEAESRFFPIKLETRKHQFWWIKGELWKFSAIFDLYIAFSFFWLCSISFFWRLALRMGLIYLLIHQLILWVQLDGSFYGFIWISIIPDKIDLTAWRIIWHSFRLVPASIIWQFLHSHIFKFI